MLIGVNEGSVHALVVPTGNAIYQPLHVPS